MRPINQRLWIATGIVESYGFLFKIAFIAPSDFENALSKARTLMPYKAADVVRLNKGSSSTKKECWGVSIKSLSEAPEEYQWVYDFPPSDAQAEF